MLPKDMTLYLIWDTESEVDKDCTIMETDMSVSEDPAKGSTSRKRSRRDSGPGTDDEDSSGSGSDSEACKPKLFTE